LFHDAKVGSSRGWVKPFALAPGRRGCRSSLRKRMRTTSMANRRQRKGSFDLPQVNSMNITCFGASQRRVILWT
jgi:hypothetical protein